jgi:twinkle protein
MLAAAEVKTRLATRAADVARYLLPHGKQDSGNWCVGSTAGDAGKSLRVQITGSHAGLWADFAGNESGDLLDLWAAVRNISLGQALKEAKNWLGIADPVSATPPKTYSRPQIRIPIIRLKDTPETEVEKYLTTERKLTRDTLLAFKIGARVGQIGMEVAYPSYEPTRRHVDGIGTSLAPAALLSVKYIAIARQDGKKLVTQEKDCPPCLFGWQAFDVGVRTCIITEGQIDAMTWHQIGYPALSVPNGTGDTENWIDFEWDNLSMFEVIYLSFDMDKAGEEAVLKVAKRLGIHRCRIIKLPHNDANECLQRGCDFEVFRKAIDDSISIKPQEIKNASDFRDQVHAQILGTEQDGMGGFVSKTFGRRLKFRYGEVSMWSGHSSHGKTTLLRQLMVEAAMAGERVAIGSFEETGATSIRKMCQCVSLTKDKEITTSVADEVIDWMGDKIWIFDVVGIMARNRLLELMLYVVMRFGVKHIVIDSLMKCDLHAEDYEEQKQFLNLICGFAKEYDVHVHIVAHPRKGDDESAPGNNDILGGQAVHAQPDNITIVWRNKSKEGKREAGNLKGNQENVEPDTIVYVNKQRHNGDEFKLKLWHARGKHRFTTHYGEGEPEFADFGIVKPVEQQQSERTP